MTQAEFDELVHAAHARRRALGLDRDPRVTRMRLEDAIEGYANAKAAAARNPALTALTGRTYDLMMVALEEHEVTLRAAILAEEGA